MNESRAAKSKNEADAAILYQEHILDSLVKVRLQDELADYQGDRKRTLELEAKLREIEEKDSLRKVELMQKIDTLKLHATGYAIAPFGDTLFYVFAKMVSYSPEERAQSINKRIRQVYQDAFFNPDSLSLSETELGTEISYKNHLIIMMVTKVDGLIVNKDHKQLAAEYLNLIRTAIVKEKEDHSFVNWLKRIALVLLIIGGLSLIIFLVTKAFRWINMRLTSNRETFLNGLTINKIKIFTAEHFEKFVLRLTGLLRFIVIIFIVYLSLPLLFSIFPETKMWTSTLLQWILGPAGKALRGFIGFLPNLFSILVIVFIFRYAIKGIKYFVDLIEKGQIELSGFHADWAHPTFRILKFLLYAFMLVLIFPYLPGSGSPAFQGVSVFVGILFSLGSSSAIANMVAGLVITYMRPFKIGDRVKIGDITGDVVEKTTLVTRIRTIKNEDVTVPNSTVLLSSTTNYSTNTRAPEPGLIIHTTVTIGYDVPWKDMHQALINAALRTDLVLKKPEPFVLQTSLDDFYVSYQINAYTREANQQVSIYSQLHQNIQDCCNEANIEIMSPHYRNQRDGNTTTIPAIYLDKDYTAPTFNVRQVKDK
ncbi:MAG TPA: mechanosensitive ion channel family protein [Bacteroidales bacterium]|nr:mechanosensitive ion channel family protein [Bacteroidales bacterium]